MKQKSKGGYQIENVGEHGFDGFERGYLEVGKVRKGRGKVMFNLSLA